MSNYDNLDYFIEVEDDLIIHSDGLRIRIIINNLLSNAIKYADPKKDKPFIAIRAKNEEGKLTLENEDNGIGIKKRTRGSNLGPSSSEVRARYLVLGWDYTSSESRPRTSAER